MGDGTGRYMGFRHACIYPLVVPFRLYGKNFAWTFFVPSWQNGIPVRSTGIPAKAGQFLSYKHSVPLCRDDTKLVIHRGPEVNNRLSYRG